MKTFNPRYPSGAFSVALALMRLSAAATLALVSLACDRASASTAIITAVLACLIAGGLLTRLSAFVFAVGGFLSIALDGISLDYVPIAIDALALAILGPGAWSIDAINFHRFSITSRDRMDHVQ